MNFANGCKSRILEFDSIGRPIERKRKKVLTFILY